MKKRIGIILLGGAGLAFLAYKVFASPAERVRPSAPSGSSGSAGFAGGIGSALKGDIGSFVSTWLNEFANVIGGGPTAAEKAAEQYFRDVRGVDFWAIKPTTTTRTQLQAPANLSGSTVKTVSSLPGSIRPGGG